MLSRNYISEILAKVIFKNVNILLYIHICPAWGGPIGPNIVRVLVRSFTLFKIGVRLRRICSATCTLCTHEAQNKPTVWNIYICSLFLLGACLQFIILWGLVIRTFRLLNARNIMKNPNIMFRYILHYSPGNHHRNNLIFLNKKNAFTHSLLRRNIFLSAKG